MARKSKQIQSESNDHYDDFDANDYEKTNTDSDIENLIKNKKAKAAKAKKAKAAKKPKNKKFTVKGVVTLDSEGNVIKHTKGIDKVVKGRKDKAGEYTVTFTFVVRKK